MFIKITNDIGDEGVNRIYLEKLGISTKRNDSSTIGQFGSGSKFAPIAALRNGWRWINVGFDENGPYQMEYVVKEENGFDCIAYLYNDEFYKDSSFTVDAGVLSWDEDFQIFREAFANALDEKIVNNAEYSITLESEIKFEPGKFSVYITAAPGLIDIINDFDKYFSLNRENLLGNIANMKVMRPHDNSPNIYYKGVLVSGGLRFDGLLPLWDYEFDNIILNEERRLRHSWDIEEKIVRAINVIALNNYDLAEQLVRAMNKARYETEGLRSGYIDYLAWPERDSNNIYKAWVNIHGERSCAVMSHMKEFTSHVRIKDYNPVIVENEFMYELFQHCGIPTVTDVIGEAVEFNFVPNLKPQMQKRFDKAMSIIRDYDERVNHIHDFKFYSPKENQDTILGIYRDSCIYLSMQAFRDIKTLIATIIHELDHHISGLSDSDAGFRNFADERIAELLLERSGL